MSEASVSLVLATTLIAGTLACAAVKYPAPPPPVSVLPKARPVVGIASPAARLDLDQPLSEHKLWTREVEREIEAAARAIFLLRQTELFSEADFICSLGKPPNLVLEIEPPPLRSADELSAEEASFVLWGSARAPALEAVARRQHRVVHSGYMVYRSFRGHG